MKIVLLISSLGSGGAERVATTLCNAWAARGDAVTLIPTYSGGGRSFYEVSENVEMIFLADVVGLKRKNLWSYMYRLLTLRRLIASRAPDVVISFLPNVNVAAILSTLALRVPLIICERSDPSSRAQFNFWEINCKLLYRFADMMTVQTESVANKIKCIYPGLNKVRAIPNPLPERVVSVKENAANRRKILLSLGRLVHEKQVDKVIDAFSKVRSRFDEWDLHIYGEGELKSCLQAQITDLGLQDRVFLRGGTNEPWHVMAGADAFVMNSKYEGFPNALLEAIGVGLPCIASDCQSGPREISRNGKDAVLVPLNDSASLVAALVKVMGNEEFRKTLGRQARESVMSRFSLATVVDQWDRLFEEVRAVS